jgi:hypothetical protein
VSGPLAEWVTAHYSATGPLPELDPHARFVLTVLALAAKHDGSDANLTREQMEEQTGLSLSAVSRALRKIEDAKAIAQGRRPGRGQPRARQVRIWWCDGTGCWTCDLLDAHVHPEKVVTSDTLSGRKVVTRRQKVATSDNPLRIRTGLSEQQRLAQRTADANLRLVRP